MKPLCIELFAGLHGWAEGFIAEGYRVVGFDIADVAKTFGKPKPTGDIQLVLQDVRTLHGSQFCHAAAIVASPPCQEPSYRAMPWKRAKALPPPYAFMELFEVCFRIQREACAAAGRYIPIIVENVVGAQRWVGSARWHYGSYYLWGDVPALMPFDSSTIGLNDGLKIAGRINRRDGFNHTRHLTNQAEHDAIKQPGLSGAAWFDQGMARFSSARLNRRLGSALTAKIPFDLAQWIARCFRPGGREEAA